MILHAYSHTRNGVEIKRAYCISRNTGEGLEEKSKAHSKQLVLRVMVRLGYLCAGAALFGNLRFDVMSFIFGDSGMISGRLKN